MSKKSRRERRKAKLIKYGLPTNTYVYSGLTYEQRKLVNKEAHKHIKNWDISNLYKKLAILDARVALGMPDQLEARQWVNHKLSKIKYCSNLFREDGESAPSLGDVLTCTPLRLNHSENGKATPTRTVIVRKAINKMRPFKDSKTYLVED